MKRWFNYCVLQPMLWRIMFAFHSKRGEFKLRSEVPKHELEAIVHAFYPSAVAFFETEEGKREFAEWKAKREQKQKRKANRTA